MRFVELTEDQSGWAKFGYAKVKLILCGPLRFNAERAEDRREPQRINLLEA